MKGKNRYMVDNSNRLIIKHNRKNFPITGKFSIDKNNRLIYWLNEPTSWRRQYDLPNKINFKGNWRLNPNYDLELNLNKTKDQYQNNRLILKGEVVSADRDALIFEVRSLDKQGLQHIRLLRLSGFWQADEYNRIIFLAKKTTASPDILTFEGAWQLNNNQQIAYTYEKTDLKTRTKVSSTLSFEGFWQINSANMLTYILSHSSNSRFDFRVQIESPNLYPKEGVIKYRLGIGLKEDKTVRTKIISLYGTWKFTRKTGLIFQIDYGKGEIKDIGFGAQIYLNQKDKIIFTLVNERKESVGMRIIFTHKFFKELDAETFLLLKKYPKESGVEAGLRVIF